MIAGMELGISSFAYGWSVGVPGHQPSIALSASDLVHRTADFGLRCLQIADNLPLHALPDPELFRLRDLLISNNINLEIGARGLTYKHAERYVGLCGFFGSSLLRFVVDGSDYTPTPSQIVQIISGLLPSLSVHNIRLGIENHDRFKASELARIMDAINHPNVGICLDCVNSLGAGEGLAHVMNVLGPYTINLHIKDFTIERVDHNMGFVVTGTPAGQGMTDVPALIEHLLPYGRCTSAVLEQWVPPANTIDETVDREERWASQSIEYLKQLRYFNTSTRKNLLT